MLRRHEPDRFGTQLRQHRAEAGLTQEELAERAGLSVRAIQALERDESHPHKDTAERLARALGLAEDARQAFLAAARRPHQPAGSNRHLRLVTADDAEGAPQAVASPAHNLPLPASSFIGRGRELAEIERLLATTRALTLTGTGGCGKTRLALVLAARVQASFADGVWLVELGSLAEPALVLQAVASALEIRDLGGRLTIENLIRTLRAKELLLVLDNCEHLVEAVAHVVGAILRACPGVSILATSREALRIAGEVQYRVPSLSVPPPIDAAKRPSEDAVEGDDSARLVLSEVQGYEAVRLFCERARAVQTHFALQPQNAAAVAQICRRLDGIPLAIELAAARTRMLTPGQIARGLDERFRLLVGGDRTAPSRQKTLRGLIDWSYDLLSEEERRLLARLAVFAGGFSLEAAEAVCGDEGNEVQTPWPAGPGPMTPVPFEQVLDVLTLLVDRSLVVCEEHAGLVRYRLLETIRDYARERLEGVETVDALRRRHCGWYLELAQRDEPGTATLEHGDRGGQLAVEEDNLRAALAWCQDNDVAAGLRLIGSLWQYWSVRGHLTEGARWLEGLLARAGEDVDAVATGLRDGAALARAQGQRAEARSLARALAAVGWLESTRGHSGAARTRFEEALAVFRAIGDSWATRWTLVYLGFVLLSEDDLERTREALEEALSLARESRDSTDVAWILNRLSIVAQYQDDSPKAKALVTESLDVLGKAGDKRLIAWSLGDLGNLAMSEGDYPRAQGLLQESLALLREVGDTDVIYWRLLQLGHAARCQRDFERARAHFEESLLVARESGGKLEIGLSLEGLANLARSDGNKGTAQTRFTESLRVLSDAGQKPAIAHCLWLLGILAVERDTAARGVRLLGAATTFKLFGTLIYPPDRTDAEVALAVARATLGADAFDAAWSAGQAMTLDQAIAYAIDGDGG